MMAISNFGDWSATSAVPLPEATTDAVPTDQEASDFAALLAASYAVSGAAPVPAVAVLPAEAIVPSVDARPVTSSFSLPKDVLKPNAPPPSGERIASDTNTEVPANEPFPLVANSDGLSVSEAERTAASAGSFRQRPEAIRTSAIGQPLPQRAEAEAVVTNAPPGIPRAVTSPDQAVFSQDGVANLTATAPRNVRSERISAQDSWPDIAEARPTPIRTNESSNESSSESLPVASDATPVAAQTAEPAPQRSVTSPVNVDGTVRLAPQATIPAQSVSLATMDTTGNVASTANFSALKSILNESHATITHVGIASEAPVIKTPRAELSPIIDSRSMSNSMTGIPDAVKLAAATIRTLVLPPDTPTQSTLATATAADQPHALNIELSTAATVSDVGAQPESGIVREHDVAPSLTELAVENVASVASASRPIQAENMNSTGISQTIVPTSQLEIEAEQGVREPAQADYSSEVDENFVSGPSRSMASPSGEIRMMAKASEAAGSHLNSLASEHVFAHELERSSTLALQAEFDAREFTEADGLGAKINPAAMAQMTLTTNSINAPRQAEAAVRNEAPSLIEQTAQPLIEAAPGTHAGETRSLRLELNPVDLGRVEVEITRDAEGRVSASFTVEQTDTAQTLTHNLGHLRETLERAGLVIEQLQVTTATPLQTQTSQQFGQQPNPQQTSPNHHHNSSSFGSEQVVGEDTAPASDNRLLSMRA